MPPSDELVYLAQVIHHDEAVVSAEKVLRERPYGGQPAAVDVLDFRDDRVSALLKSRRDDELVQVIHRARLLMLKSQTGFEDMAERRGVRLVIHTSHPIPGLRVDRLVLPNQPLKCLGNENGESISAPRLGTEIDVPTLQTVIRIRHRPYLQGSSRILQITRIPGSGKFA